MASLVVAPNGNNKANNNNNSKMTTAKQTSVVIEMKLRDNELNESIKGIEHVLATYKGRENVITKPLIKALESMKKQLKERVIYQSTLPKQQQPPPPPPGDNFMLTCQELSEKKVDIERLYTVLKFKQMKKQKADDAGKGKQDLFFQLPIAIILDHIVPWFCNVKEATTTSTAAIIRNGALKPRTIWDTVTCLHDAKSFVNIFGKTKKSFSFVKGSSNEAVSVEKYNGRSVKETYHTLMLAKKYKGTPTLLNGCKNNTMTLRDASILMNVCNKGINHLGMQDDEGKSALYYAGYTNNDVVGNYLITSNNNNVVGRADYKEGKRVFLEEKYGGGKPVLLQGCKSGAIGFNDVETLVEICQVNISETDEKGNAAIYYAGYNNMEDVGNYLWSKGADNSSFTIGKRVMLEDKYGGAPALINGCQTKLMTLEDAKVLVEDLKVDITATTANGKTAMYYAAFCKDSNNEISQYLLSKGGKEIDLKQGEEDWNTFGCSTYELNEKYKKEFPRGTPLVCACEKGRVEDVEGMIRGARAAGMDVTAMVSELGTSSGGYSWTPLMIAAFYEHSTIIEILLQCNADTATTNKHGENALHYAAWNNKTTTTTVQLLLNNMKLEDINHISTDGRTPLDLCYDNDSSIQQQLIDLIRQKGGKRKREL